MMKGEDRIKYIIKNWDKKTLKQLAKELGLTTLYVSTLANRIRNKGIPLSIKTPINWNKLRNL